MIQIHLMKKPRLYEIVKNDGLCNLCGSEFYSANALQWHQKKCYKRSEAFAENVVRTPGTDLKKGNIHKNNCEVCDEIFVSNSKLKSIQMVQEHKETAHPVDMTQYRQKKDCEECDFGASNEKLLKKHERDCHNTWDCTKSISPPPKRKRHVNDIKPEENNDKVDHVGDMDDNNLVDEAVKQMEKMELEENDELKKRSDQMDEKIIDKRKREDMEEEERRQSKNETDHKEKAAHNENKKTNKPVEAKQNKQPKKHVIMKEGISVIEEKYWELVGENRFKVDTKSDGTCQVGAKVTALIGVQDQETKLLLAKEENKYLLEHFEIYKESFAYPHVIKIGLGGNMTVKNEDEFKMFLAKNPKAAFMWGDQMQLQITANMHQVKIHVLKISPNGKATVWTVKPDSRLSFQNRVGRKTEDIWLILKGEHYDTLVKKDHPLVTGDLEKISDTKKWR